MSSQPFEPLPASIAIRMDPTPFPDDPPEAATFYHHLGIALVAWGRFEGHFVICLYKIMKLPGAMPPANGFPASWKQRAIYWRNSFKTIPCLRSYKNLADDLIRLLMNEVFDRNFIAHAMWREFGFTPTFSARALLQKPRDDDTGGINITVGTIDIDGLKKICATANLLNRLLEPISVHVLLFQDPQQATGKSI